MASDLACIAEELRRLQREGIDRVFLDEATLGLLRTPPSGRADSSKKQIEASEETTATIRIDTPGSGEQSPKSDRPVSKSTTPTAKQLPDPPKITLPAGSQEAQMEWLQKQVLACEVCRAQRLDAEPIIFGSGPPDADLFFCGHAPGADEVAAGEPFAGDAGTLLTKMIQAMQLSREAVYLADIVKWRPHQASSMTTRLPTPEELDFCLPYLRAQIEIIRPKVIIALGNTTLCGLIGPDPDRKFGSVRGQWSEFAGIPMMITFHPAYLQNNGTRQTKRAAWEDCLQVMEKAGLPISEKQRGYFLPKS